MARVLLTSRYSELNSWPGRLFEANDYIITTTDPNLFVWEHGGTSPFAGYTLEFAGTGFTYDTTDAVTGGTINSIKIRDEDGNLVLTIDQMSGATVSRDLAQIFSDMFGWLMMDGPGPDGKLAWNHLLSGNDTIIGTSGDDQRGMIGSEDGNDLYLMKGGEDFINCGSGRDTVNGGGDFDFLTYQETAFNEGASAYRGINVNMVKGTVIDCWGFTDKIIKIEAVYGSRFNDKFLGSDADDEFAGFRGRDVINGGKGRDAVVYYDEEFFGGRNGIFVDLETSFTKGVARGFAIDSYGQRDTLISMEDIFATNYDDTLIGSRVSNRIQGRQGSDTITGGGGQDEFYFRDQGSIGDDDLITDFAATGPGRDVLQFNTERFDAMSTTLTLVIGAGAVATTTDGTFIFDTDDSTLYWDEGGTNGPGPIKVVTLTGVSTLTAANFDLF